MIFLLELWLVQNLLKLNLHKNKLAVVAALIRTLCVLFPVQMQTSVLAVLNITTVSHSTAVPEVQLASMGICAEIHIRNANSSTSTVTTSACPAYRRKILFTSLNLTNCTVMLLHCNNTY